MVITDNDDKKYEVIPKEDLNYKENESDMDYAIRSSKLMDTITHWKATTNVSEDGEVIEKEKIYKFYKSPSDGEYVFEHDNGEESLSWMFIEGEFLIEK